MTETEYTPAQIRTGISRALKARDMPAVAALLHRLAIVDPKGAQQLLDAFEAVQQTHENGVSDEH